MQYIHTFKSTESKTEKNHKTRNTWQSLAYSPLGAIVSPPSEYL